MKCISAMTMSPRLRQRSSDAQERLVGKAHAAFGNCMDVAGETEVFEVIKQVVAKAPGAPEPVDLLRRVTHGLEKFERVLQSRGKQKAAPRRQPPDEEFKHGLTVFALVQVGLDHVQFVEVGEEGAGFRHHT